MRKWAPRETKEQLNTHHGLSSWRHIISLFAKPRGTRVPGTHLLKSGHFLHLKAQTTNLRLSKVYASMIDLFKYTQKGLEEHLSGGLATDGQVHTVRGPAQP